jgi:8-oxo-dGTP pyrophosphatase MutT (NUDIX family)
VETPNRPSVITAIVTSDRGVLIGHRHDGKPPWTFIAGEQKPGEVYVDTILREVKEETGLEIVAGDILAARPARAGDLDISVGEPPTNCQRSAGRHSPNAGELILSPECDTEDAA